MSFNVPVTVLCISCLCAVIGCNRVEEPIPAQTTKSDASIQTTTTANIDTEQLIEHLKSRNFDRWIEAANQAKMTRYQEQFKPLLLDLWNGKRIEGVDPGFVNNPRVRIEIADILAQMERNGTKGLDRSSFRTYARKFANADDQDTARQAVLVLGITGYADDLPFLEKIALESDPNRFRVASISITRFCATTDSTIEKVRQQLTEEWRKTFLTGAWQQMASHRNCQG